MPTADAVSVGSVVVGGTPWALTVRSSIAADDGSSCLPGALPPDALCLPIIADALEPGGVCGAFTGPFERVFLHRPR
ncbi:MAG: hypothetical protein H6704_07880 [Myxococcales bacterium]|nr:hypothetical protein [Myxococcales bacterium]